MSRKAFDKLCTIYRGTTEDKFVVPLAEHIDCGLIVQDGIFAYGPDSLQTNYYLTIQDVAPLGSWVPGGSLDLVVGDWIEIEEPGFPIFTVVYVRFVDWKTEIDYFQGHLVPFRRVRRTADGGILLGGSADVSTNWVGAGGVVVGGVAVVAGVHRFALFGSGGIRLGGDGCPYSTVVVHGSTTLVVTGSGGVLIGGAAEIEFGPPLTLLVYDSYSDGSPTDPATRPPDIGPTPTTATGFYVADAGACSWTANATTDPGFYEPLVYDAGVADGVVQADITSQTQQQSSAGHYDGGALIFRYVDDGNFWMVQQAFGFLNLLVRISGSFSVLASTGTSIADGETHQFKVRLVGDDIKVFLDGVQVLTYNDGSFDTATIHGIVMHFEGTTGVGGAYVDEFKVFG